MENIMVIFGGESVEHDISIITGVQIANACAGLGFLVRAVYIDKANSWHLCKNTPKIEDFKGALDKTKFIDVIWKVGDSNLYSQNILGRMKKICAIDFAILCSHGKSGEDGTLPALFELSHLPYSSSNFYSCALAMDKCIMKDIFYANNIPSLPYYKLIKDDYINNKENSLKEIFTKFNTHNLIIKPACLGSSIGIGIAKDLNSLKEKLETAFNYDDKIIIEPKLMHFIEVNCSVRKKENKIVSSICEYPKNKDAILSFEDKYLQGKKYNKNGFDSYLAKTNNIDINNCNIIKNNHKNIKNSTDINALDNLEIQKDLEKSTTNILKKLEDEKTIKNINSAINNNIANKKVDNLKSEKIDNKNTKLNLINNTNLILESKNELKEIQENKITSSNKLNNDSNEKLLPEIIENEIQELAKKIYKIFDASGIVRIDFLYDVENNIIYANELNSIPGSLSLNLWLKSGVSNAEIIKDLIKSGKEKFINSKKLINIFSSSVLDYY